MLKILPLHEADNDSFPAGRIFQHLQPWVQRLLQVGAAELRALRLNADILASLQLLGHLPLRHLELEIGQRSIAQVSAIMAALGKCATLEYLVISVYYDEHAVDYCVSQVKLPDLCLQKAAMLKHLHLHRCFPGGILCLPYGCQLTLDMKQLSYRAWNYTLQSGNERELLACIPAMCLRSDFGVHLPHNLEEFTALQYLELRPDGMLADLAMLQGIPHVKLELSPFQESLLHSGGSWQSLEIESCVGYGVTFADIDAFVRDNPRYLFESTEATKAWRSMECCLACCKHTARCRVLS